MGRVAGGREGGGVGSDTCRDVKSRADAFRPQIAKHTQLRETMQREAIGVREWGGGGCREE